MPESSTNKPRSRLTPVRRRVLDWLLDELYDLPAEERGERIAGLARRTPRLATWLARLNAAGEASGSLLDGTASGLFEDALQARLRPERQELAPGTCLGPWRIIDLAGIGGMGDVYRAERADGSFDMQVAVKLIRTPSDDLARLLASERQTLARLKHPDIARLLDGGVADDGRPYLVMDWVDGLGLDEWCEQNSPSLNVRLRVFSDVCAAVSAAHRELIVHGDIKPQNLKVRPEGRVSLLDFGVARLLDRDAPSDLPAALTPGFAAPEVFDDQPLSTSADIFGLGSLLYWLLYGEVPPRAGEDYPRRRLEHRRWRDLDAMVRRARNADPELRYPSADALASDIRRLALNLPIRARRAGAFEHFALWTRRHALAAALGVTVVITLLGGVAAVSWQARVAAAERDLAQAEAEHSNALREHLTMLFREVGSLANDAEALTARELLDRTASVADEWLADDPRLRVQVKVVLGEIMIALNDFSAAETLLGDLASADELISDPLLKAMAFQDLAQVHHRRGRIAEGLELADRAVKLLQTTRVPHTVRLSDALQVRGRLLRDSGRLDEALADLRRARNLAQRVSSGPRPLMARAESNLGTTLLFGGDLAAAARHFERSEALWLAIGRPDSSDALATMANLAMVLDRLGRAEDATRRLERVIELREINYGDSGAMAAARTALGRQMVVAGQFDLAEEQIQTAAEIFLRFIGADTPDYAAARLAMGELQLARGHLEAARAELQVADEIMRERVGETHPYALQTGLLLAVVDWQLGTPSAAADFVRLAEDASAVGPVARPVHSSILCQQARVALSGHAISDAVEQARNCLTLREELGYGGWRIAEAAALLAAAQEAAGEPTGLSQAIERLATSTHEQHPVVTWLRHWQGREA